MTARFGLRPLVLGLAAAALASTVGLPAVKPLLAAPWAPLLGVPTALVLFAALARRRPTFPGAGVVAAVAAAVLVIRAAVEELVWRGVVLGALAVALGALGGLALSSAAFAYAHARLPARRRALHLATGAAFGAVYLVTGRLLTAIVAHAGYNVLVWTSGVERPQLPVVPPLHADDSAARLLRVHKRFSGASALDGVDLELRFGEVLALVGPNGAGKSTAVSVLLGLRRPDEGTARLCGLDPALPAARRSVGVVPQEVDLPPGLRVREVVELVRAHHVDPEPSDEALGRFGLRPLAGRQAGGLSGGERRRVALALALAGRPRVLVLDEPTAGLDVESRRTLHRLVREHASRGGAVLLTTHDLDEVASLADRVLVLHQGRVIAQGTVEQIRNGLGLTRVRLAAPRVPPLDRAARVEQTQRGVTIYTADAPGLMLELVALCVPLDGIEVQPPPLEEAFLALIGGDPR